MAQLTEKYTPIRDVRRVLTPAFASWYQALPSLESERPVLASHVTELVRKMEDGSFIGRNTNVATVEVRGQTYKLNGQHTCAARLQFNGTHDYRVNYQHYKAKSVLDAAELYMQFDAAFSTRSYDHLFNMYNQAVGLFEENPKKAVKLAANAIAFDRGGRTEYGRRLFKGERKAKLPAEEPAFVKFLAEMLGAQHTNAFLFREPVVCAIYQTYRVDADYAASFWPDVRDGDMLKVGDPAKRLRDYLQQVSYAYGRGSQRERKATFHEIYSKCVHGWNAAREGKATTLKVFKDAPLPEPH